MRDALTAAFNARFLERFGPWPCDYAGSRMVTVARRTEQAAAQKQQPPKPIADEATVSMQPVSPFHAPVADSLVAQAVLSVSQIQDLEEQISALTKACVDYFGVNPTFSVRIEVQPKVPATREQVERVNEILGEVSGELKLK